MQKEEFLTAPLPFQGQKRMFISQFKQILKQYPEDAVFVDLFGGSGLLSHVTKKEKPQSTVIYNDYDNYQRRLKNISRTNILLAEIRCLLKDSPRGKLIPNYLREKIYERFEREEKKYGFVDYITFSSSLLFSMKYAVNLESFRKESLYNNIRRSDYRCDGYLEGLIITSLDYRELFEQYKDTPNVVFLVDPPYLTTDVGTYTMSWKLSDYLDVLKVLNGTTFIYFTSEKSSIIELCQWMGNNQNLGNPFEKAVKVELKAHVNYCSSYKDIMLYNQPLYNAA